MHLYIIRRCNAISRLEIESGYIFCLGLVEESVLCQFLKVGSGSVADGWKCCIPMPMSLAVASRRLLANISRGITEEWLAPGEGKSAFCGLRSKLGKRDCILKGLNYSKVFTCDWMPFTMGWEECIIVCNVLACVWYHVFCMKENRGMVTDPKSK